MSRISISVLIPFYNKARFFEEAVTSVLKQSFQDYELLLCDDGSTDGSTAIAKKYARTYPDKVRYLQHPGRANLGQFSTRIFGARNALAPVIAPLDHDDVWESNYLERHFRLWRIVEQQGVYLSYGPSLYWFYENTDGTKDYIQPMPPGAPAIYKAGELLDAFMSNDYAATPLPSCTFLRKEIFQELTQFEGAARSGLAFEDQYLSWYAASRWPVSVHCNPWVRYRQHSGSYLASSSHGIRAREAEFTFLRTMNAYLAGERPDHPLLRSGRLSRRLEELKKGLGVSARLREALYDNLPNGAFMALRAVYRSARDFISYRAG